MSQKINLKKTRMIKISLIGNLYVKELSEVRTKNEELMIRKQTKRR